MIAVDLTAAAAFTAAALSLVNVAVSARMTQRGQREQWRRDAERPIVARILTISSEALELWGDTARAKGQLIDELAAEPFAEHPVARDAAMQAWQSASAAHELLRFEVAQLDLIGGRRVRSAATALLTSHESANHWLRPAGGASDIDQLWMSESNKIVNLTAELVAATRADLGVGRHRTVWPRR
jgi:hypothetical protein